MKPLAVKNWIDKDLTFGQASRKRAKDIISRMLDLAMLWELTPTIERNPMQLVKVKGATKRQKPLTILRMEQFVALVRELSSPVDLIVFLIGNLGLRVSEALAFKWSDIDEAESTITVQRVFIPVLLPSLMQLCMRLITLLLLHQYKQSLSRILFYRIYGFAFVLL
jgi:integrase